MEHRQPLTEDLLDAAARGEPEAVQTVLEHFAPEIDALCTKTARRRDGTLVSHIDEDMRSQIRHRFLDDLAKRKKRP